MAVAKRAEAFGCFISYRSRAEKPNTKYKSSWTGFKLQNLVVSCPLNDETYQIIDPEIINALGPKGFLINIGRGALVDESELVSALLEEGLAGAGLDVFEHEPQVPEELFGLENVVLLPHAASGTEETRKATADIVIENLEACFLNKPLLTPVVWLQLLECIREYIWRKHFLNKAVWIDIVNWTLQYKTPIPLSSCRLSYLQIC